MSEPIPQGNPQRPPDPTANTAGPAPDGQAQGVAMPGTPPIAPVTPASGFALDPDATLPLTPAYAAPQPRVATPPGGWPVDPAATQPATQPWGAPPPWAGPGAAGAAGWAAGQAPPPGWAAGQTPPPGWVPDGAPPVDPYAAGGWEPESGPQAGTAYGTRPPTPPNGTRRGAAASGGGSGRTPPAIIVGSVIGVAAILAIAVWFLLLRPGDNTATSTPTPAATTFITPPPTATPEPDVTDEPATPEPTRFRNPTFAGLRLADAQSLATRSNVTVQVTYEVTDAEEPDTVISQDPPPGTEVLPGDVVRLTVAAPQPTVAVPDLRGSTEADAVATLVDVGLAAGIRSEAYDPDTAAGLIILTDPRGGIAVARGTAIDYLVSLGPEPSPSPTAEPTQVPAPTLVDLTLDEARALADELGLVLDVQERETLDADAGTVIGQEPEAGQPLRPGDRLTIVVAVRPTTVVVPDVQDRSEADAVAALFDAGLEPGARSEAFDADTDAGLVIRTDPRAGIAVAPGTVVDYLISLGAEPSPTPSPTPEPAFVPDIVGLSIDDAQALIDDAGLLLAVEDRETLDAPEGTVLEQDPAPDSELRVGDTVAAVVAVRPGSIAVPVLRGLAEADALTALADAALVPGERTERYHASIPAGAVIRSDPAAGTIVALDTSVDYVVSLGVEPTPSPEPTPAPIALPDLSGLALADVQAYADEQGLILDIVDRETEDAPPDTILDQDPPLGAELRPGDTVRVTVARQPANVSVPSLRGLAEPDAVAALLDTDLQPGERSVRFHASIPAGAVVRSDPAAGASVPRGSSVDYTVSAGPEPTPTPSPTPAPIVVPSFVGGPVGDAQRFTDDNGLTLDVSFRETSDAPPDTVLEQDPAEGGELRPGDTLQVRVAAAPTTALVPDVRGMAEADAIATILESGLAVGDRAERFNDAVAPGAVIRTIPAAGTDQPLGSLVDYVVSRGPEPTPSPTPEPTPAPVIIPELVGVDVAQVRSFTDDNGLRLDVQERETLDAPAGTVLEQDPAPGAELPTGETVRVVVAVAPALVTVPELRGLSEADGVALLSDAGLVPGRRIDRYNASVPAEAIVRTDPASGTDVPGGTVVDYVVSRGPEPIPAPTFVGLTIEDAQNLASTNGLTLDVTEVDDDTVPTGTVLAQDPVAGDPLTGTTVRVSVARNTALVPVPELRGLSEADAVAALTDVGLVPGRRIDRFNDNVPADAVVRSDPAAGTEVAPGTSVDYVVSKGVEPVLVPDLQGLPVGDAEGVAGDVGLTLDVTYEETRDVAPDTVIAQDPAPDSPSDGSGTVRVTVARAPSTVQVPRMRGLTEEDAVALLLDAGLEPGRRSERNNADIPEGSLLGSDPRAGTEVAPGTRVDYTVSRGPAGGGATPEPTAEPTPEPTPIATTDPGTGGGLTPDTIAALDAVVGQVPPIRELEQRSGIPYVELTPKQLRRALRDAFDAQNPPERVAAHEATLKRLGLLPADADLRQMTLDLLESQVVARYDPATDTLAIVARDGLSEAALRFYAAGQVTHALVDQQLDLGAFLALQDPTQADRGLARMALALGDAAATSIDWAGQVLSGDEQASIPGLLPTDQALLDSMPLYVRRMFTFPTDAGRAFVDALRATDGWNAVNGAYDKAPASTEQILHPDRYRADKPVTVELPDLVSVLGGGWSVSDERIMGELGIGIWLDDGIDGSPNAWAADNWGGDRLVALEGPDGAWAIAWQTAWDTDADADEFTGAAEAAMADLPDAHVVLRGADLSGGLPSPALVIVASDQGVIDSILAGTGLGG